MGTLCFFPAILRYMNTLSGEVTLAFTYVIPPFSRGAYSQRKEFAPLKRRGVNRKLQNLFPLVKMRRKHGGIPIHLNKAV